MSSPAPPDKTSFYPLVPTIQSFPGVPLVNETPTNVVYPAVAAVSWVYPSQRTPMESGGAEAFAVAGEASNAPPVATNAAVNTASRPAAAANLVTAIPPSFPRRRW